tara:strand:+ start:927 stop:1325 length:399 start_codon:yes stop_codon:yes gene_type:complete
MQNPYFIVVFDIFVKLSPKLNAKLYRNCVGVFYMESEFKKRVLVLMSGFVVGVVVDPCAIQYLRQRSTCMLLFTGFVAISGLEAALMGLSDSYDINSAPMRFFLGMLYFSFTAAPKLFNKPTHHSETLINNA